MYSTIQGGDRYILVWLVTGTYLPLSLTRLHTETVLGPPLCKFGHYTPYKYAPQIFQWRPLCIELDVLTRRFMSTAYETAYVKMSCYSVFINGCILLKKFGISSNSTALTSRAPQWACRVLSGECDGYQCPCDHTVITLGR